MQLLAAIQASDICYPRLQTTFMNRSDWACNAAVTATEEQVNDLMDHLAPTCRQTTSRFRNIFPKPPIYNGTRCPKNSPSVSLCQWDSRFSRSTSFFLPCAKVRATKWGQRSVGLKKATLEFAAMQPLSSRRPSERPSSRSPHRNSINPLPAPKDQIVFRGAPIPRPSKRLLPSWI